MDAPVAAGRYAQLDASGVGASTPPAAIDTITALYRAEHAGLVRYARARFRTDPEDLVQEAFGRLLRHASRGAWPDEPTAWLQRVIQNLGRSDWRHLQVVDRHPPPPPDPPDRPDALFLRHEAALAVTVALHVLQPDARRAVVMAANGRSTREIGGELGRTELATRALLWRARARLRTCLEESAANDTTEPHP